MAQWRSSRRAVPLFGVACVCAAALATGASAAPAHPTGWLLQSPLRAELSGAGEISLLHNNGLLGSSTAIPGIATPTTAGSTQAYGGTDVRINQPGHQETLPNCTTQNEVHLAAFGNNVVAGWNDGGRCEFFVKETGNSLSGYGYSTDGGQTWTDGGGIEPAPGANVWGDPVLAADADGNFYYATLADEPSGRSIIGVARSTDGGQTWSEPVDASPGRSSSSFQDKEWMAVDTTASAYRNNVYVAWVEFTSYGTQDILFSRSTDGAQSFFDPIKLNRTSSQAGTGTQVAVGPDGQVYVVWLASSPRALWFTSSSDGGQTFSSPTRVARITPIGHRQNCGFGTRYVLDGDIRVREWPSLAVDVFGSADPLAEDYNPHRGKIYIAASSDGQGEDESDMYFLSSSDEGSTWSEPMKLNDDATAYDNFHPQVAVAPDSTVAVQWYDRRLSALRPNWDIDVFAATSSDGGATFSPNFRVTDVSFPPAQTNPNSNLLAFCYMGEYNGMVGSGPGRFLLDWGDNRDGVPGLPDPNVYFDVVTAPSQPVP